MITSIRLSNWRSHGDSLLEFGKGTNLLIGSMGAGKSSVLDAISFALFGTFPALERRKLALDDLLRLNENNAAVAVEFHLNGNKYKIERKLVRDKKGAVSDAFIYKDNALVDKGPKAATTYIEQLLNVDYDLFTRAIYSEQNNIDYFLTVDPKRRKEELDTLLGLDKFEIARANIVSVINRIKSNRKTLEERFSREHFDSLKEKKKEQDAKIVELKKTTLDYEALVNGEKAKTESLEKAHLEMKSKKDAYEKLKNDLLKLEALIESLGKELAGKEGDEPKLLELKNEKARLDKLRTEHFSNMKNIDMEYSRLSKELATAEEKTRVLEKNRQESLLAEKRIKEMSGGATLEMLKAKYTEMENHLLSSNSQRIACMNEIAELEKYSKQLSPELLSCPLCGSSLTKESLEHVIEERKGKIVSNRAKIADLEKNIQIAKNSIDASARSIKSIEFLNEKITALKDSLKEDGIKEKITALQQSITQLDEKRAKIHEFSDKLAKDMESVVLALNELESIIRKKAQLKLDGQSLFLLKERLKQFEFNAETFERSRNELENARLQHERHFSELANMKNQLKMLIEIVLTIEKEIAQLSDTEEGINKFLKLEEELVIYKNALLETQLSLRTNLMEAINLAMNEIWQIFYPYKNYKQLRLNVTEKDYAFEIFDSDWKPLESIASGGERACAALTLRVALSTVLTPNLSWLILDEPTHNLDKEAIDMLSHALQFKVPSVISQTFVITHEEGLMGSEFASSYKLMRDKDNFGATKIERI